MPAYFRNNTEGARRVGATLILPGKAGEVTDDFKANPVVAEWIKGNILEKVSKADMEKINAGQDVKIDKAAQEAEQKALDEKAATDAENAAKAAALANNNANNPPPPPGQ